MTLTATIGDISHVDPEPIRQRIAQAAQSRPPVASSVPFSGLKMVAAVGLATLAGGMLAMFVARGIGRLAG